MPGRLKIMMGVPGVGKSYYATKHLRQNEVYISRDNIRFALLSDDDNYFGKEKEVFKIFMDSINTALIDNKTVIADASNLTKKGRAKLLSNLSVKPASIEVIWVKADLNTCLKQNSLRTGLAFVPKERIKEMYNQLEKPALEEGFNKITIVKDGEIINTIGEISNIFFTSDLHLYHDKDFVYQARGFTSVEEMVEAQIERWNSVVQEEDIVYILGDLMLGDKTKGALALSRLNGRKRIILGNHDTDARKELYRNDPTVESVLYADVFKYKKRTFYLSHFPTLCANHNQDTFFNLFGHTHSTDKFERIEDGAYNVGQDAHNCTPVSIATIIQDLANYNADKYK